jgi:hypothetical protein
MCRELNPSLGVQSKDCTFQRDTNRRAADSETLPVQRNGASVWSIKSPIGTTIAGDIF